MDCQHQNVRIFELCSQCGHRNLPTLETLNDFELFGLKPVYFVDVKSLQNRFYELSRILHPDKFQNQEPENLDLSTRWTARLNQALNKLKSDDLRAFYLFDLAHFNVSETKVKSAMPHDLSEEYFNLQDELDETSDELEKKNLLKKFKTKLVEMADQARKDTEEAFHQWERTGAPLDEGASTFFVQAAHALSKRSYLKSMAHDLEKKWPH